MKKVFLLILVSLTQSAWSAGNNGIPLEIKKFRFHKHPRANFERLVIEFTKRGDAKTSPTIRMTPSPTGKETMVYVNKVNLVGAIPESTINDSYVKRSRFFGPISINTDDPSTGFVIRTFIKDNKSLVDAFWLEKPSRLIIDVFPKDSARVDGPNVLAKFTSRDVASHKKSYSKNHDKTTVESVFCFPAASLVGAAIGFKQGDGNHGRDIAVEGLPPYFIPTNADGVVCYPKRMQMVATITFTPKSTPFHGHLDVEKPKAPEAEKFSWGAGTTEESMNRDADLALGGMEEPRPASTSDVPVSNLPLTTPLQPRNPSSASLMPDNDNFNKNAPPPTLGKSVKPALANPGSLLPPLK